MTHGFVVAMFVLAPEKSQVGQGRERFKTRGSICRTVPKEGETKESIESRQAGNPRICERTVNQQMVGSGVGAHQSIRDVAPSPCLEDRELVEESEPHIGDAAPGLEGA